MQRHLEPSSYDELMGHLDEEIELLRMSLKAKLLQLKLDNDDEEGTKIFYAKKIISGWTKDLNLWRLRV